MKRIILKNVNFSYNAIAPIFSDLNCELGVDDAKGHITALMGSSGAGKTTLLKLLLGLLEPQKGSVTFYPGNTVFSYVPQEAVLFEHLSPIENARYFQYASFYKNRFSNSLFEQLVDLLEMRKILENRRNVSELSGGQKQRLSLLRALSINPEILLLDEPCTGLDADVKISFLSKLHELTSQFNILSIYVTHHIDEAKFIANDIAFLNKDLKSGFINSLSQQSVKEFLKNPPSLDALSISRFPALNIFSVSGNDGNLRLTNSPEHYICIDPANLKFNSNGEGIKFVRQFKTDTYATFKHAATNNVVTLQAENIIDEEVIYLNIGGSFNNYSLSGIFNGQTQMEVIND